MKNLKKQINKILVNFLNDQHAKRVKSGEEEIVSSFENDKFSIDILTRKESIHPTDPNRFDMDLVGDYDAVFYYKGTKDKVSKEDFKAWCSEFVLVDVNFNKKFHNNEQFVVTDDGQSVFIHLYGSAAELYDIETEFFTESYHDALNKCLEDAGIEFDPYSRSTLHVVAQ
jgi:hypothetical protein